MSWNGSGVVTWLYTWGNDAAADIKILASRQDGQWADAKTTIQNCLTRDGQNAASANLPMGGFKHTGVAAGSARTDYASLGNAQDSTGQYIATDTGTAGAYVVSLTPAITAYASGQEFKFLAANTNTAAPTIAFNGLTAQVIKDAKGAALASGAIESGSIAVIMYDGTNFRLIAGGKRIASPISAAKLYFYGQF